MVRTQSAARLVREEIGIGGGERPQRRSMLEAASPSLSACGAAHARNRGAIPGLPTLVVFASGIAVIPSSRE